VAVRAAASTRHAISCWPYSLSGFFAGIAEGSTRILCRIAGPSTLEVSLSFTVVIWAIFGGVVTIYGPVGAFSFFPVTGVSARRAGLPNIAVRGCGTVDSPLHA